MTTPKSIIKFWFSEPINKHWFNSTPEIDALIHKNYASLWQTAIEGKLESWKESAESCLALILLLDQFSLNMFRNDAKCFVSEAQAIELTIHGIAQGFDKQLNGSKLSFFYIPLMHSELMEHQNLSVKKFELAGLDDNARFAKHHRHIIEQFGRFPHRNKILNRESTTAELDYLKSKNAFTG